MSDSAAQGDLDSPADSTPAPASSPATPARGLSLGARLGIGFLVVCAGAALFWPRGSEPTSEPAGSRYDLEGHATTLGTRLQPVTLVHFWATWCGPCIQEVPALRRLEADFSGRQQFGVVMIAVQDEHEKVRVFLGSDAGRALFDPNWEVAHRYGTQQLPETYLLVNGKVAEKFIGMTNWDDPAIRDKIEKARQSVAPGA
jgi:thiol-disulfide isomerase/thioredoxin